MKKLIKKTFWAFLILLFLIVNIITIKFSSIRHFDSIIATETFVLPNNNFTISPSNICDIRDFGTVPEKYNKAKNNRRAIQTAINSCTDIDHALFIPPGIWFTGGLYFNKNSWIIIDKQATLSFVYNPELYMPLRPSRFEGYELMNFSAPLYFDNLSGGGITGGGKIKIEEPKKWHNWNKHNDVAKKRLVQFSRNATSLKKRIFGKVSDGLRPPFIQLYNVKNFILSDIVIEDSTMWTIHALYNNNLLIQNLNIFTHGSNTDGIVIDSSTNIILKNNTLHTGDDAIVLKSGSDHDGRRINKPTNNILIQNTTINDAHGAIVIGSEMTGGIENIKIEHTNITKADIGLRIKTRPGRGGYIRNISLEDLQAQKLRNELVRINTHYNQATGDADISDDLSPIIENITLKKLTSQETRRAISINGIKKHPIKNLFLKDITATQIKPSFIININNSKLKNLNIDFEEGGFENAIIYSN